MRTILDCPHPVFDINSWGISAGADVLYNVYDNLGRMVSQSLVQSSTAFQRGTLQSRYDDPAFDNTYPTLGGSSNAYKPFNNNDFTLKYILSETHYGGYAYTSSDQVTLALSGTSPLRFISPGQDILPASALDPRTTGLQIYQRMAVLDPQAADSQIRHVERAYHYDYKGRVIQTVERNHLGGISRTSLKYDFQGNVLLQHESVQPVAGATSPDVLVKQFTYDHRSRLLSETTTLNDGTPAVVTYGYDELGKLVAKTYGTGTTALTDSLKYNIQGWLTEQKNPLFEMKLHYYDPARPGTAPSFTGNISEWDWRYKGSADISSLPNTYAFTYDALSRLTDTRHYQGTEPNPTDGYTERGLSYDHNGNILTLQRTAARVLCDNFTYTYQGNKLIRLSNAVDHSMKDYAYDRNGNMIHDGINNLDLHYNYLNLISEAYYSTVAPPMEIEIGPMSAMGGSALPEGMDSGDSLDPVDGNTVIVIPDPPAEGTLMATYRWLADGTKAGVKDGNGTAGFEYLGSLVYKRTNGQLLLESAAFGAGRIIASQGSQTSYTPKYFLTDHLGSTRMTIDSNGSWISDYSNYYPFGMRWSPSGNATTNRWLYNGKEQQTTGALNYLDYGARMRDPRVVPWMGMDRLAENFSSVSPYVFCFNNPVRFQDPDGNVPLDTIWDIGNLLYDAGAAVVNHIQGDHAAAKGHWVDAGWDLAAVFIPYVPAGTTKLLKAADKTVDVVKAADKGTDAAKAADKAGDTAKAVDKTTDAAKATKTAEGTPGQTVKREASAKSREKWENATGEKWPKDPSNSSKNQDISHKKPLADGGANEVGNIEPKPHGEHMKEHKDNGDFKRWGQRRN